MNYAESLIYLDKVIDSGIKFGLENVKTILKSLDDPQNLFPSVIVAGTNGKGSVCAMLTRIVSLHGYKAGLYTSPHLIRPEERIRIGDSLISEADFAQNVTVLSRTIEELIRRKELAHHPTYFETMTCLAFLYFAAQKIDIAFLEVGMGGRFDATNVVDPILSVITTISLEHQKFLGDTVSQIASEKAGIIKSFTPVICGVDAPDAMETIKKRAAELDAPFIPVFSKASFGYRIMNGVPCFEYIDQGEIQRFRPSLPGLHQGRNAAIVVKTATTLAKRWRFLEDKLIINGIETTQWEGRLEKISDSPLVVLDGAHNEEGIQALHAYAEEFLPKPITLIFAAMRDKNIEKITQILFPVAEKVILTRFPFHKAADPEELKRRIPETFTSCILIEPDPFTAFERGQEMMSRESSSPSARGCLLIAGSLFLVGEAKKYFQKDD